MVTEYRYLAIQGCWAASSGYCSRKLSVLKNLLSILCATFTKLRGTPENNKKFMAKNITRSSTKLQPKKSIFAATSLILTLVSVSILAVCLNSQGQFVHPAHSLSITQDSDSGFLVSKAYVHPFSVNLLLHVTLCFESGGKHGVFSQC